MKFIRRAQAQWKGRGTDGSGKLTTQSGVLKDTPYSINTRFKDEVGANPEELIGAAHAGCFAMQLSVLLSEAGYAPEVLDVSAKISFEDGTITKSALKLDAKVPDIEQDKFEEIANEAKKICPISKLLKAEISLESSLNG